MNEKKIYGLNRFLAERRVKIIIAVFIPLFFISLANYFVNGFCQMFDFFSDLEHPMKYWGIKNFLPNPDHCNEFTVILYGMVTIFAAIIDVMTIYRINVYLGEKNLNVGQKGDSRWTTLAEIKEQYKEIPEKNKRFPGGGGIPICRYKDKIYIDDTPVNNSIIGMTRSGKGEMFVFPMIDIYSRAQDQASMIITDLKIELYPSAYQSLKERGYDVYLLNLIDPIYSMGFDPLYLIVQAYKAGRYSDAETLCTSYAYSIYNPSSAVTHGDDRFWAGNSTSALGAMILALIDDCLKADKVLNKKMRSIWEKKQELYKDLCVQEQRRVRELFEIEKEMEGYTENLIKKVQYIPDDFTYVEITKNEKKINMYSVIIAFSELAQEYIDENLTKLDLYFLNRPRKDKARLKYASIKVSGDRTKGSIFSNTLNELSVFIDDVIAKLTAESTFDLENIGFGDRPVALFIGLPEYDKSKHFIATSMIRQIYFILAKKATMAKGQKCKRDVVFILDEFGNLPPIENLMNIFTMCLSRRIYFNLIIQSYQQVHSLYGDDAISILDNCGNQIYILTDNQETAEKFSDTIGSETITNVSRTGEKLALKKNMTESFEEKPLLNKNQLMELKIGECVVKRTMKRQDLKGGMIRPRPIFNSHETETAFKYRHQYLLKDFPDDKCYMDIPMETRDHICMEERVWDPEKSLQMQGYERTSISDLPNVSAIFDILDRELEEEQVEKLGINMSMKISEFNDVIMNQNVLSEMATEMLLYLVESMNT